MNEVQKAWKAYLAERPGIDPGHVPEDGSGHYMLFGRNYQLFREGWDRKKVGKMDYKTRANYKPIEVERPTDHPNRIFAEDLRVGMVIRRRGTHHARKLIVILGEVEKYSVPSLQLLVGHKPWECGMHLAAAGLKPYGDSGKWKAGAWCEEVT